jgi:tetratricopeptide (TPR) repeat protein
LVFNEEGEPIEGATVTLLLDEEGPPPLQTNDKGAWSFLGLKSGKWIVRVESEGLVPAEAEILVSEFDRSKKPIEISLRPMSAETPGEPNVALDQLQRGNELLQEGKPAEARAEYEAAIEHIAVEERIQILLPIARTYYLEGNMEQTEVTLRQALDLEPENVDALKLLSNLLITEGRAEEADEFIARLPEGEALPADAYLNPGIDLYNQGDLDGALAKFEAAAASHPDEALVYYYRGLVLVAKGQNERAAADFNKLLELEPEGEKAAEAKEFLQYLQ